MRLRVTELDYVHKIKFVVSGNVCVQFDIDLEFMRSIKHGVRSVVINKFDLDDFSKTVDLKIELKFELKYRN